MSARLFLFFRASRFCLVTKEKFLFVQVRVTDTKEPDKAKERTFNRLVSGPLLSSRDVWSSFHVAQMHALACPIRFDTMELVEIVIFMMQIVEHFLQTFEYIWIMGINHSTTNPMLCKKSELEQTRE